MLRASAPTRRFGHPVKDRDTAVDAIGMGIDDSIDRLVRAYTTAGLGRIRPPGRKMQATVAEIVAAVAPLRLPDELLRFWERVDPRTVTVGPYPSLASPDFALQTWRDHRDAPGQVPRILFPVAYESHGFRLVELHGPATRGGACFGWGYTDAEFRLEFTSLTEYVDLLVTMIELGEFTTHRTLTRTRHEFDPDGRWGDAVVVRLAARLPHPVYGNARAVDATATRWPEHWLAADGAEDRTPRGATARITDLLAAAEAGNPARGTIRGRVVELAGTAKGVRVRVNDGTDVLDVWCPAAVCAFGPAMRREFEFDVVVRPDPSGDQSDAFDTGEVQSRALPGDLEGAQAAAAEQSAQLFGTPSRAEATAVRPVD
ncbi:MAG TPA: hypothetical protein VGO94_04995 [Mycobacteriales bacterium]|nr:hypothetical protein [Mycobacteriales bacterium]